MRLNDVHQSAAGGIGNSQVSFLSQLEAQFRELWWLSPSPCATSHYRLAWTYSHGKEKEQARIRNLKCLFKLLITFCLLLVKEEFQNQNVMGLQSYRAKGMDSMRSLIGTFNTNNQPTTDWKSITIWQHPRKKIHGGSMLMSLEVSWYLASQDLINYAHYFSSIMWATQYPSNKSPFLLKFTSFCYLSPKIITATIIIISYTDFSLIHHILSIL